MENAQCLVFFGRSITVQQSRNTHMSSSRVATNLRQILRYMGPPAASCNLINTMRKGFPSCSIVMAFEDAFRTWGGKLMPHLSEWRPINTSSMSLRSAAQGHTFQSTIHSPAWMDLVHRSRGRGLVSKKGMHNLYWDLLSMAISQVEPALKPYDTYLPPLNSHRVQDAPLNNLDGVHNWMRLHRPAVLTDSKGLMTVASNWVGEGKDHLLRHFPDGDILAHIIKVLYQRVSLGLFTMFIKIRAHRGEFLNEKADRWADEGREDIDNDRLDGPSLQPTFSWTEAGDEHRCSMSKTLRTRVHLKVSELQLPHDKNYTSDFLKQEDNSRDLLGKHWQDKSVADRSKRRLLQSISH